MSRDSFEYDNPPGLGYLPNGTGGMESQRSTSLLVDRRGSASFSIYEGFEVPNRHNPGGSASLAGLGVTSSSSSPSYHHQRHAGPSPPPSNTNYPAITRSTLLWSDLEPWMDGEYAKQVCALMGWDPISINIPHSAPDTPTGQLANNPGYCYLTFPSQAHAASVLAGLSGNPPISMPNSTNPFSIGWASLLHSTTETNSGPTTFGPSLAPQSYSKEYSIFVGDLAPETSNSDLVAVFRNPVLGLRNDREPKFIRPFLSCKSAKIMLDPVTGVSRGYGFVRFTDETDQQRALIEMHGLYCLSRPMRISPATAKFKQVPAMIPQDLAQLQQFASANRLPTGIVDPVTVSLPLSQKSVSASIASITQPTSPTNLTSVTSTTSASSLANTTSTSSLGTVSTDTGSNASLATSAGGSGSENGTVFAKLYDSKTAKTAFSTSITAPFAQEVPRLPMDHNPTMGSTSTGRYLINEESWKHHTQARAILGNLIGPNGEQLTSTDPYNTTVFVGGLSPLIQEDTLRTFFAPFGDIHYVKVPVGKHCGFVQFVRKADAERAIEKMQGFPIGGSRIRLSWGRSQYKAAQAAAQAAQAAALHGPQDIYNTPMQMPSSLPLDNIASASTGHLTQEQAVQLLQKLSQQGYMDQQFSLAPSSTSSASAVAYANNGVQGTVSNANPHVLERMFINPSPTTALYSEEKLRSAHLSGREDLIGSSSYNGYFDLQTFSAQQQEQQNHVQHGQQSVQRSSAVPHSHQHQSSQHLQYSRDSSTVPGQSGVSFSPFSPDPNALYVAQQNGVSDAKRRESYGLASLEEPGGAGASIATKFTSTSTRPASVSRYASFQNLMPRSGTGSTGASPTNRSAIPVPISRPLSGRPPSASGADPFEMHDLNGTLASLDLGDVLSSSVIDGRPWGVKSPPGSSDSGASVQFQMTRDDITSA
ncbi:hypothetical protein J3R30DRAFT_3702074 [Lentinula aciculospora]|uniref:RRM domain-containing protein n=1 Tax=Lentinula aciculospora TaxID=153920 RepID=A0A9W9DNX7_9AGAR|nr:hypothetical protein J3R30DRAFT_3702074 [Lentinula aciculospora]